MFMANPIASSLITQRVLPLLMVACASLFGPGTAVAQDVPGCGSLRSVGQYGPYDYRTDADKLPIVLGAHFTPEVEALVRGRTSVWPGNDIDYTLRAIPNNHRALLAMMRLGEKEKTPQPRGAHFMVECYFQRAIAFRPDDAIVRMIYSTYLNSKARTQDANAQLETAITLAKDNGFTHYNIGLHFFELKNYDKALVQAHRAMALGFARTDLQEQLTQVGKWTEPSNDGNADATPGEK